MKLPSSDHGHGSNRLLRALHDQDFARLEPHLQVVDLARGRLLFEGEEAMQFAYFPHDCVVSLVSMMHDGRSAEMTAIGCEGFVDPAITLQSAAPLGRYVVQLPGTASRMELERLTEAAAASPGLQERLARYAEAFLRQTLQLVACSALHPVEARICRWILMTRDRLGTHECAVTQDAIAEVLGVQRSTISLVVGKLQDAGIIATRRGSIEIVRPDALSEGACECYSVIRRHFERLLST